MSKNQYIFDVTTASFAKQVLAKSNQGPVLVDFWAAWCQPCQMLMPILRQLTEEYQGKLWLAKINTDEEQSLAVQYQVRGLPTLKLFRNGEVVDELVGVQPAAAIRTAIDRHIVRESDLLLDQAQAAQAAGQQERSFNLLRQAADLDPENHRVSLALAAALFAQGKITAAERIMKALPLEVREENLARGLLAQIEFAAIVQEAPDRAALEKRIAADPKDSEARYLFGVQQALSRNYEGALEQFLELLKCDRKYKDEAARKALLAIFNILGSSHELVIHYRRQMFRYLH